MLFTLKVRENLLNLGIKHMVEIYNTLPYWDSNCADLWRRKQNVFQCASVLPLVGPSVSETSPKLRVV